MLTEECQWLNRSVFPFHLMLPRCTLEVIRKEATRFYSIKLPCTLLLFAKLQFWPVYHSFIIVCVDKYFA